MIPPPWNFSENSSVLVTPSVPYAAFCYFGSQITRWHPRKYKCVIWEKSVPVYFEQLRKISARIFWAAEKKHEAVSSSPSLCSLEISSFVTTPINKIHSSLAKNMGGKWRRCLSLHLGEVSFKKVLPFLETIVAFAVVWLANLCGFIAWKTPPPSWHTPHSGTKQYKVFIPWKRGVSKGRAPKTLWNLMNSWEPNYSEISQILLNSHRFVWNLKKQKKAKKIQAILGWS